MPAPVCSARRARRYPAASLAGSVGAAHRLRCGAQSGVARQNSLRAVPALRSNRLPRVGGRSALRAPTPALRSSPPHTAPPPGTACRVPTVFCSCGQQPPRPRKGAFGQAVARLCGAEERKACGLARSASWHLTRCACSSAAPAQRARSELRAGPQDRAPQGSRRAAPTAAPKRHGLPGRAFAPLDSKEQSGPSKSASRRRLPVTATQAQARGRQRGAASKSRRKRTGMA